MSGLGQHRSVEVGGKDLHESSRFDALKVLAQQDGDGVGLLARGATWDPDADGCVGGLALHDARNDLLSQGWNASGSRKNWVTPIRRSLSKPSASAESSSKSCR